MEKYLAAKERLSRLSYRHGASKWQAFWAGNRAACMGRSMRACPYRMLSDEEKAAGKRTSPGRKAWLNGYAA